MKTIRLLVKASAGLGNEHIWINPEHIMTVRGHSDDYEIQLVTGLIYTLPKCGNPSFVLSEKGIIP